MSVRAEPVRLGLRLLLKPGNGPDVTIARRRRRDACFERWVPRPPADTEERCGELGGVPAVRIATPSAAAAASPHAGSAPCDRQDRRLCRAAHGDGPITGCMYTHGGVSATIGRTRIATGGAPIEPASVADEFAPLRREYRAITMK